MIGPHLALVGPTASGKSGLAMAAARALGDVEIVAVDSMQVYRGMDIGTAKPSPLERAEVPHHCLDLAEPGEEWSVVRFGDAVRAAVDDVERRGRRALLVGGTGLYFRAVVDALEFPGENRALRESIDASGATADLYAELSSLDPAAAERIEPANRRRIVRALEVIRLTGRPFSAFGPGLTRYAEPAFPVAMVGLRWSREALAVRIRERLAAMREAGLVDEVRGLMSSALSQTARQAIGYAEIIGALEGRWSLDEAFIRAEQRTRQFARRQLKWFERDPRIRWIDLGDGRREKSADALEAVLEAWTVCAASA